jgi:hypothetical protein
MYDDECVCVSSADYHSHVRSEELIVVFLLFNSTLNISRILFIVSLAIDSVVFIRCKRVFFIINANYSTSLIICGHNRTSTKRMCTYVQMVSLSAFLSTSVSTVVDRSITHNCSISRTYLLVHIPFVCLDGNGIFHA